MMNFPIVEKLGGRDAVSALLGITPNALRMQAVRGSMPWRHVRRLMSEAARQKVPCEPDDFEPREIEEQAA